MKIEEKSKKVNINVSSEGIVRREKFWKKGRMLQERIYEFESGNKMNYVKNKYDKRKLRGRQ